MKSLNFCFSNLCSAQCVFCPTDKGNSCSAKLMSAETFFKILNNLEGAMPEKIIYGENGDLWLNPHSLDFMRELKKKFPNIKKSLFTNFYLFSFDKIKSVMTEGLVDEVHVNLDSLDELQYELTKGLDLRIVLDNLKEFNKYRDLDCKVKLFVYVLNAKRYYDSMTLVFSKPLNKLNDDSGLVDDTENTLKEIQKFLRVGDEFCRLDSNAWAERKKVLSPESYHYMECPQLDRVQNEVFVRPDGGCYLCCLDSRQELVYGSLVEQKFTEVFRNSKHQELVNNLLQKKFFENGYCCSTVLCCYYLMKKLEDEKHEN